MPRTADIRFIKPTLQGLIQIRQMLAINRFWFFIICFFPFFSACKSGPDKPTFTDTPTSGDIMVVCDESYQPLISVESDTFHSIYQYAKVKVKYLPEAEAFKQLV